MFHVIRMFILFCAGLSASASALSYASLDNCLLNAVDCRNETEALLQNEKQGERDWYMLMYYNLSARWELDNLEITTEEVSQYAALDDAPDVFRIVVYTIYAKKLLTEGNTEDGADYVQQARELIMNSTDSVPDPRRLAELINLYNYLHQYETANEVAVWALNKTAHIRNPYVKASLYLSVGHVAGFLNDYPRAVEYYGYVVEASEKLDDPMNLAFGQANLAIAYRKTENYDMARFWLNKAVASIEEAVGDYPAKNKTYLKMRLIELDFLQGKVAEGKQALKAIKPDDVLNHHRALFRSLTEMASH